MQEYIDLVQYVLKKGTKRQDRTGTGTFSVFGPQIQMDLRQGFPLLTTKEINFSNIVKETLWILGGKTNIKDLGAHFWDPWADKNGELGPIYGYQLRNWGGLGIDQVRNVLLEIKTNPFSRRLVISNWNVSDLPKMHLPPCHGLVTQFYVDGDCLDLKMYQRSVDVALGLPYNIGNYALNLILFAHECSKVPRNLIITMGDVHIYSNHIEGLLAQISREPRALPSVMITSNTVDSTGVKDIMLHNYNPWPAIKFEVSV